MEKGEGEEEKGKGSEKRWVKYKHTPKIKELGPLFLASECTLATDAQGCGVGRISGDCDTWEISMVQFSRVNETWPRCCDIWSW